MPGLSTFLGRDAESAALAERVASRRVVTVVGPGGIGKTRLVEELLSADRGLVAGPRLRCELAAIGVREEIEADVAGQLGFSSCDALLLSLGDTPALLVLDNCEHVLAAAAALCRRLVAAAPGLHVLATSREPLGVDGEEEFVLGPLALPATSEADDVERAPATRLFEDRARAGARREASAEKPRRRGGSAAYRPRRSPR